MELLELFELCQWDLNKAIAIYFDFNDVSKVQGRGAGSSSCAHANGARGASPLPPTYVHALPFPPKALAQARLQQSAPAGKGLSFSSSGGCSVTIVFPDKSEGRATFKADDTLWMVYQVS